MRRLALGLLLVLIVAALVLSRGMGFTSRMSPWRFESVASHAARRWATPPALVSAGNPAKASPEVIREAMAHWADHCAICHGNDGRGNTTIGRSIYPPAPDMRAAATQSMTDGELFYVIEHGIPLTGMPAWSNGTPAGEESSWELVQFIRHLPKLTDAEIAEMEKMNPKSPTDTEREKKIEDFLSRK